MNNESYAHVPHDLLVAELLAPALRERAELPLKVTDQMQMDFCQAPDLQATLHRRLGIARELLLRQMRAEMAQGIEVTSPQVLRDWLRMHCAGMEHEVFLVLYLTANHQLIGWEEMFRGTLTQTSVYPREVVKSALKHNAAALVVAHNHPSGRAEPSRADEHLTQTLKSALALVDVRLLDHFVVGAEQTVSMAERGLV